MKEPLVSWPFADVDVFVDDCLGSLARSLIPLGAILKGHPQNLQDFELPPTLSTFSKSYTYSSNSMQLPFLFHCISLPQLKAVKTWRHFVVTWKIDLGGRGKGKRGIRLRDALIIKLVIHPGSSWRSKAKCAFGMVAFFWIAHKKNHVLTPHPPSAIDVICHISSAPTTRTVAVS